MFFSKKSIYNIYLNFFTLKGKKSVAKKLVKRPSTKTEPSQPEVKSPKGMISVSCPSCSKVHTVDENTTKFICSCGRRIRV